MTAMFADDTTILITNKDQQTPTDNLQISSTISLIVRGIGKSKSTVIINK